MKMYIADFETTVDERPELQTQTEVWAYGLAELFDPLDHVTIDNSIEKFFEQLKLIRDNHLVIYFVNLKFDGQFIVDYLFQHMGFRNAYDPVKKEFKENKCMNDREIKYIITDIGVWYSITIKIGKKIIEFRDLLKLIPLSVAEMGKAFNTKHRKLEMEYKGERHAGGKIDPFEASYLRNDILVPKEALEIFIKEMKCSMPPPLTLGMLGLSEFKKLYPKNIYDLYFPNLAEIKLDPDKYLCDNADAYCRKAYGGGWVEADERYTGTINGETQVYDANSLFPSVMHTSIKKPIGFKFPVGKPTFFDDPQTLIDLYNREDKYFFIQFRCKFRLKPKMLPFVQIKNSWEYRTNENLISSYKDRYGYYRPDLKPIMLMTETMFKMFKNCYHIEEFEFLNGCWFEVEHGLFDPYINKYIKMKQDADKEGNKGKRHCSKIALNVLYGKFGTTPENGFFLLRNDIEGKEEEIIYTDVKGFDKKPVYVPIAAAITSYAKRETVTAALINEKVYPGSFRYCDTDSLHLCLPKGKKPVGIKIDDSALCCWKLESISEHSLFLRQKTYMEWTGNDYTIKVCGLPDRSKNILRASMMGLEPDMMGTVTIPPQKEGEEPVNISLSLDEAMFISEKRTPEDFKQGLSIPGKLMPKKIKGGCVLVEDHFTIL